LAFCDRIFVPTISRTVAKQQTKQRVIPDGKSQVNFNITKETLEKVKSLAFWEGVANSDIYNKAVEKFIELYEKKHGKIKSRPVGKGLDQI
jgi:hypothetical protein